jgi:hypothetical protein
MFHFHRLPAGNRIGGPTLVDARQAEPTPPQAKGTALSKHTAIRRIAGSAAIVAMAVGLSACEDPPTSITTNVSYGCEVLSNNILVPNGTQTVESDYTVTAPQAVKPGADFEVKVVPEPYFVDGTPSSYGTVTETSQIKWRVAIPTGTTLNSQSISGWAGVGPGAPASTATAAYVEVSVPGPIPSNTTATLPTLTMNLKVTAALGSTIHQKIHGTSYAAYGFTLKTKVTGTVVGTLNPTFNCYPNPSPGLHPSLVSNDVTAPIITITTPVEGATYPRNSALVADFSCSDGDGVGVASCVGTVADGATISTATAGAKTFTVTATDNEGKVSTKTVNYTVS